mmetsp:Transcript_14189/g.30873  ORF Transcript_14189/g.30873 Transcript_14189/m.30873 type:complete len:251 (+) Transcript_14189:240-992(+)
MFNGQSGFSPSHLSTKNPTSLVPSVHVISHHVQAPLFVFRKLLPSLMPRLSIPVVVPLLLVPPQLFRSLLNMFGHIRPRFVFVLAIPRYGIPSQRFACLLFVVSEVLPVIVVYGEPLLVVPLLLVEADGFGGLARRRRELRPRDILVLGLLVGEPARFLGGRFGGWLRARRAGLGAGLGVRLRRGLAARLRGGLRGRLPALTDGFRGVGVLLFVLAKYFAEHIFHFFSLFSDHGCALLFLFAQRANRNHR